MGVPIKYYVNEHGVVINPTVAWFSGTDRNNFTITIGSKNGFMWASATHGGLSDRGWGSPVSHFKYFSREDAIQDQVNWMYKVLLRLDKDVTLAKDRKLIAEAIRSLCATYDVTRIYQDVDCLALIVNLL